MNQENRRKVLFLITKATWGGAQKYVYDLATHLPRDRFSVTLAYGQAGRLSTALAEKSVDTHTIDALGRDVALISDVTSFFQILKFLKQTRPDILHLNSSKAAALGAFAGRIAGVRTIVFTAHGWPFKEQRGFFASKLIYFLSWLTAALSHRVIVVSTTDETLGKNMWWVAKKISHIPLGREALHFLSPEEGFRAMFGTLTPPTITGSTLRLVSIAELTVNKGIRYAIDGVEHLVHQDVDVIYVVVGGGEQQKELEAYAREKGVADRVFFTGQGPADVAKNLLGFDAFLLPSIKEGMPYVLIEAAQAGMPVIATTIVKPDFEQFAQFSFVPARDALALADAITRVAHRPRVQALENPFPIEPMVSRTMALYSR